MKLRTVAELIEELQKQDPNAYVILSEDDEGWNFHPWSDITASDRFQNYGYGIELIDPVEPRYKEKDNPAIIDPVILWP